MDIIAHWQEATRCVEERVVVEKTFARELIRCHGSPEEVYNAKVEFLRQYEPPGHRWRLYWVKAFNAAAQPLSPTERKQMRLTLDFLE